MSENEEERSYILMQFVAPGSVVFNAQFENVTPLQILALAHYLEYRGKRTLAEEESQRMAQQEQQKIIVPKQPIPSPPGTRS